MKKKKVVEDATWMIDDRELECESQMGTKSTRLAAARGLALHLGLLHNIEHNTTPCSITNKTQTADSSQVCSQRYSVASLALIL